MRREGRARALGIDGSPADDDTAGAGRLGGNVGKAERVCIAVSGVLVITINYKEIALRSR